MRVLQCYNKRPLALASWNPYTTYWRWSALCCNPRRYPRHPPRTLKHHYLATCPPSWSEYDSSDIISNLSVVPEDQTPLQGARFTIAEVLIPSPNAALPSALAYASDRNTSPIDDPRGDVISDSVFTLDATDGKLRIINQLFTHRAEASSGECSSLRAVSSRMLVSWSSRGSCKEQSLCRSLAIRTFRTSH